MWASSTEPWTSFDRIHVKLKFIYVIQFLKSISQYRVTFIKGKGKSRLIFPRISKGHWDNKESLISFLSSSTVSFRFEKNLLVCYPYPLSFSFFVFLECCLVTVSNTWRDSCIIGYDLYSISYSCTLSICLTHIKVSYLHPRWCSSTSVAPLQSKYRTYNDNTLQEILEEKGSSLLIVILTLLRTYVPRLSSVSYRYITSDHLVTFFFFLVSMTTAYWTNASSIWWIDAFTRRSCTQRSSLLLLQWRKYFVSLSLSKY